MIRRAKASDAEAIEAIEKAWPTAPKWTQAQIEQETARKDAVFLVDSDGDRLSGHAVFRQELEEAHLLSIAVRPDLVRKRVGRGLLEALVLEAERLGLSKMTLEVGASNQAAVTLYLSSGFEEVGRRKDFYGKGEDALLLDRPL
jgi:ribosomal-protein-alanine acetyltransferase